MRSNPFSILEKQQYTSLTIFRKNGLAVATPVWFALVDHKLFVMIDKNSGKEKRIRNNPCVSVEQLSQGLLFPHRCAFCHQTSLKPLLKR